MQTVATSNSTNVSSTSIMTGAAIEPKEIAKDDNDKIRSHTFSRMPRCCFHLKNLQERREGYRHLGRLRGLSESLRLDIVRHYSEIFITNRNYS